MKRFARGSPLSFDQPAAYVFMWPIEMMLRFNANVANTFQEAANSWTERRREAAEDAIETFDKLVRSRDLGEAVTVQQEWLENSIRRIDEDFNSFAAETRDFSHRATEGARQAISRSSGVVRDTARAGEDAAESMHREGEEAHEAEGGNHNGKHSKSHKRAA